MSAHTVDLQQSEAEQAELTLSKSSSSPKARRITADNQGEASKVSVLLFDLRAKKGRIKITDLVASAALVTDGAASTSTAFFYQKQDGVWKLVASAAFAQSGFNFADMTDVYVKQDETSNFKLEITFTSASVSESAFTFTIQTADITAENDLGDDTDVGGSAVTSDSVRVTTTGPTLTLVSKSIKFTPSSQSASGVLEATFVVRVKAGGADIYIQDRTTTSSFQMRLIDDDGASVDTEETASLAVSYNQPVGTTSATSTYRISEDTEADVTVTASIQSGAIGASSGFKLGKFYKFRVIGFRWDTAADSAPATNDTYMDASEWETTFSYVN